MIFLNSAFYLCTVFIVIEEKGGFISRRTRDKWPRLDAHCSSLVCVARILVALDYLFKSSESEHQAEM